MSGQTDHPVGTFNCVLNAWNSYEKELLNYLIHRIGDRPTAEDLLQEIFLKSIRQGIGFCQIDNPRAWLFQVAKNIVIDHSRLSKPLTELTELTDDVVSPQVNYCDPVEQLASCLVYNLNILEEEDRKLIEQCDLQGVSQQEFADMHELSLPAVKSRLRRIRQRLRKVLIRNCKVHFDNNGRVCCHTPRHHNS